MTSKSAFATIGRRTDNIEVRLSYRIVELFSEGLYTTPNKAIEELVTNSFDAGARTVHVLLSSNLHDPNASIAVFDDGEGMDQEGLKRHWLIGVSNKRSIPELPRGRQQIGKFGIGKLATYILSNRLTHISKCCQKYYSTSMDFSAIDRHVGHEIEPEEPITLPLRELTETQAKEAVGQWINTTEFQKSRIKLFGSESPESWTFGIMSSLKDRVHEIKMGSLGWILRTALPLRPDFGVWLNGIELESSKTDKGLLKRWVLGQDIVELPRPSPKSIVPREDKSFPGSSEYRFGLHVPKLGRITGYAEAYKDLLTGRKSDKIGRSHGFFVYVRGRLLNVTDGHFGISPNELRHGTFGRFRLVVHIDGLDAGLRSNREAVIEGELLSIAQDVLRAIFNKVRLRIDRHDNEEKPGSKLARILAASPASLSRKPIVELSRSVVAGKIDSRYLIIPKFESDEEKRAFFIELEERVVKKPDEFITGSKITLQGQPSDGITQLELKTGVLLLNGWHPLVAVFHDALINKTLRQLFESFAIAEILAEAHLHHFGIEESKIENFLNTRDQLLRNLANESGRQSALSVANSILEARNSPDALESAVCDGFRSLGFEVISMGKRSEPDGVAAAHLPADKQGKSQHYKVSLEAKSKQDISKPVSARSVDTSAVIRHRNKHKCDHAVVIAPSFPTSKGNTSALGSDLERDRADTKSAGAPKTITLINVDDLAKLVRLRPLKQIGLKKLRELFQDCGLPEESSAWVESIQNTSVERHPYRKIIETIEMLQKKFPLSPVEYPALRVKLADLTPPIKYETDNKLIELCTGMSQMAPNAIVTSSGSVELDQSAENAINAINTAMQEYPPDEQLGVI